MFKQHLNEESEEFLNIKSTTISIKLKKIGIFLYVGIT